MEIITALVSAFVTIFSIGLFIIALRSYKKTANTYLVFISCIFIIFLIKGILYSLNLFFTDIDTLNSFFYSSLFDFVVLFILFITTLKK